MGIASKHHPLEYGHKSYFDADKDAKPLLLLLLPFEDYKNCIKSIVWKLGNAFGVRSIEISELTFDKVTVGILNGLHTVVLHPSDAEKNNGLTLQKLSVGMPVYMSAQ